LVEGEGKTFPVRGEAEAVHTDVRRRAKDFFAAVDQIPNSDFLGRFAIRCDSERD
jgi:hypothetical protein